MKESDAVGVRELKNQTSAVLRRVRGGAVVTVTDRGLPIARIVPVTPRESGEAALLAALARAGRITSQGGKPAGAKRPPEIVGEAAADAVLEDRRSSAAVTEWLALLASVS